MVWRVMSRGEGAAAPLGFANSPCGYLGKGESGQEKGRQCGGYVGMAGCWEILPGGKAGPQGEGSAGIGPACKERGRGALHTGLKQCFGVVIGHLDGVAADGRVFEGHGGEVVDPAGLDAHFRQVLGHA